MKIFPIFMTMIRRVALLGIYHESNTFIDRPTTIVDFEKSHFLKGDDIRREYLGAHHEIGGMLEVLDEAGIDTVPLFFAEATPGGVISADTYHYLLSELLREVQNAGRLDGCLVVPHGAAVAEGYEDMDGHWLSALRGLVGPRMPIIGTLDPHANLSAKMVGVTNALVAYATNPHLDQRETGKKAARLMVGFLNKTFIPTQAFAQPDVAISIEQQYTAAEPCASLYQLVDTVSRKKNILSVSVLLGFPYSDVHDMGSSFLVVADTDMALAEQEAQKLKDYLEENRNDFVGDRTDIESAIQGLAERPKPALLLDMGDNVGGGSPGNSTFLLDFLEARGISRSFICIYDPEAAHKAAEHNVGDRFSLSLGDAKEIFGTQQYRGSLELLGVVDGKFREKNPRHGGQVNYDMGLTAIVRTVEGNCIMINSLRVPPFSLSQLTSAGVRPEDFAIIVAKGVNAPIAAYGPVCPTIIQVNTPGPTQADMTKFNFKNRRKPLFPFEQ